MKKLNQSQKIADDKLISRKVAILRAGKYAAFTAATMMLLMSETDSTAAQKSPGRPKHH